MARKTRLGVYGGPEAALGAFSGKGKLGSLITRLGLYGGPRPRYGTFDGKQGKGGGPFTRLGLYGGPRPIYSSFAGKQIVPTTAPTDLDVLKALRLPACRTGTRDRARRPRKGVFSMRRDSS